MKSLSLIISFITIFILSLLFTSCNTDKPIVSSADYEVFIDKKWLEIDVNKLNDQIDFWDLKLEDNLENQVYQQKKAGLLARSFKLAGNVEDLGMSDEIYESLHERFPNNVNYLHALTANAITQHEFKAADDYVQKARITGEKLYISNLLLTDVNLERGNFVDAMNSLEALKSTQQFDYFIRKMKMCDESGNLDEAIEYMEKALDLAYQSNNESLINWSLSNLGDMYGHQGKIDKSYNTFLKALERNPADLHSLKGIAWIAFSHDKNYGEAIRILNFLKEVHPIPDYDLMLSDIAVCTNDKSAEFSYKASFISEASKVKYGKMYNSYLAELFLDMPTLKQKGLDIAENEIIERPHPVSYSLKAWAQYKNGEFAAAESIISDHVEGKTGEPNAVFRTGAIYLAAGNKSKAKEYLTEAKSAAFELGPIVESEIDVMLVKLTQEAGVK